MARFHVRVINAAIAAFVLIMVIMYFLSRSTSLSTDTNPPRRDPAARERQRPPRPPRPHADDAIIADNEPAQADVKKPAQEPSGKKSVDEEIKHQEEKLKHLLSDIQPYDIKVLGIVPQSKGIVFTGGRESIKNMAMSAILLRKAGCTLPIHYSYTGISQEDLEYVKHFNISVNDMTSAVRGLELSDAELSQGAHVVHAIIASPFEQVLYLDTDTLAIRDPAYLFETQSFVDAGAVFWPDFNVRQENQFLQKFLGVQKSKEENGLEFEAGQFLIDKKKTWKGLIMARHLLSESKFYFQHMSGAKEAFYWAFKATTTPYYVSPNYPSSVGAIVNPDFPHGSKELKEDAPDAKFCGHSVLNMNYLDDAHALNIRPLFMHWSPPPEAPEPKFAVFDGRVSVSNIAKLEAVLDAVDYFQLAKTYDLPSGESIMEYSQVGVDYLGRVGVFESCVDLKTINGLDVHLREIEWDTEVPWFYGSFKEAYKVSRDIILIESLKAQTFLEAVTPYRASTLGIKSGSRGIVMTGSSKDLQNVIASTLVLRDMGCKLPVSFMHIGGHISDSEIDWLRMFAIETEDFYFAVKNYSWYPDGAELSKGAAKIDAILAAPFEEVLYMDTGMFVLRDPTYLFDMEVFKRHGALAWSEFRVTSEDDVMWRLMSVPAGSTSFSKLGLDSAQVIVDKRVVWKGLKMAQHILGEARFYFQYMETNQALFWGFEATQTPYFLAPTHVHSMNATIKKKTEITDGKYLRFCGHSMVQLDFEDSEDASGSFKPKPLFAHINVLKELKSAVEISIATWNGDSKYAAGLGAKLFTDLKSCARAADVIGLHEKAWEWDPTLSRLLQPISSFSPSLDETQVIKLQRYIESIQPYDARQNGIKPVSFGVVMVGSDQTVGNVLRTAQMLRETGCKLKVQMYYLTGSVSPAHLQVLRSQGIEALDISKTIKGRDWDDINPRKQTRMLSAGVRLEAILASSFERVLFIDTDTDTITLTDPTSLFDANPFKFNGALFWPGFSLRRESNMLWNGLGLREKYVPELTFESGQMMLDKSKVWKALKVTQHLMIEAKYYFDHISFNAEVYFWGFMASNTPYYLIPSPPRIVGVIADKDHPRGDGMLQLNPPTTRFCGMAKGALGLSTGNADSERAKPVFLHVVFDPEEQGLDESINYFQTSMVYRVPEGRELTEFDDVNYSEDGQFLSFKKCISFKNIVGLPMAVSDWSYLYPKLNEMYRKVFRSVQKLLI